METWQSVFVIIMFLLLFWIIGWRILLALRVILGK
jgi:hypothetical protein